jgi:molybdopterin synthase sulfur carrier subunit
MSVNVRIPTILRTYTGGSSEVAAEGATVGEVLDDLEANHTGIKARFLDGLGSATPDGTQISIIPAVAGG